jgi:hypothetical protein
VTPLSKAWLEAYLCGDEVDDLEPVEVRLMLSPTHGLGVNADLEIASVDLALVHPDLREPVELGWSDLAHWHSHVLRVEEAQMLSQRATLEPAVNAPQATAYVLLALFTLPTPENLDQHVKDLMAALETLGFTPPEIAALRARSAFPHLFTALEDTVWSEQDGFWVADGNGVYAMRCADNEAFPHAQIEDLLSGR